MPCYIDAVASSLQVHGGSSWDGYESPLDSPEGQCSIGFQPVFCLLVERCFLGDREGGCFNLAFAVSSIIHGDSRQE
jgi:hypothetical protein